MNNKELIRTVNSNSKNSIIDISQSLQSYNFFPLKNPHSYIELNEFRQKIEEERTGFHHRPYQAGLKRTFIYQAIFFSLGFLFLFLCVFMYPQTMNWSGSLIFVNSTATKMTLCMFTFMLSLTACTIGLSIRAEKEAVNRLIHQTQSKVRRILAYKKAEYGLMGFLSFGYKKEIFHDTWEKIRENKRMTYNLLEQISNTEDLDNLMREKLYNQTLLELNDRLHSIICEFKKKIANI